MQPPQGLDPERLKVLRATAKTMHPKLGGVVSDLEKMQVLIFTRGELDIAETVMAVPLSLLVAAASQIVMQVGVPSLAQSEAMLAKNKIGKTQ